MVYNSTEVFAGSLISNSVLKFKMATSKWRPFFPKTPKIDLKFGVFEISDYEFSVKFSKLKMGASKCCPKIPHIDVKLGTG